jgi:hypothetical protein
MFPTVSSAMYGKWKMVDPNPIIWQNPDGSTCNQENDLGYKFYWICPLELGFRYNQNDLVMPILHLIDGSGSACMVNQPVCGTAPQYTTQDYSDDPEVCNT